MRFLFKLESIKTTKVIETTTPYHADILLLRFVCDKALTHLVLLFILLYGLLTPLIDIQLLILEMRVFFLL